MNPQKVHLQVVVLEDRFTPGLWANGTFAIIPPGGGQGHETLHGHPQAGVIGLRTAEAQSGGVIDWQLTHTCESFTPPGPPRCS